MAIDIARSHHEPLGRRGYRTGWRRAASHSLRVGAGRCVRCPRSSRIYKPALSHTTAVMTMTESSPGQFDPALLEVFRKSADQFDRIFRDTPG